MKSYIKYAVVAAAFALSIAFGASAQAAPQFGAGNSPYLPLVQVQVCGQGGNGCNPSPYAYSPSISGVQPGDNVWVMIYYNNIGTGTATGTKATLSPQTTGVVNSQTFTATLSANNASAISGSATVNLAQGQTLTYYSTKVYGHNNTLLSSTTNPDPFTGGVNIGNVEDSSNCPTSDTFCHQGVVVITYKVGNNNITPPPSPQNCQITNFSANPSSISANGSSTLSWNTSGCASAIVSGGIVYVNSLNGSQNTGTLQNTTTYTITAYGYNGSPVTQSTTVFVNQQQSCYVNYFNASPTYVSYGGSATLSWSTTGANSVSISGLNYGYNQSASGSVSTGPIYGNQTYTLTANCQNGQTQVQTITVSTTQQQSCYINSFYASPSVVSSGNATTLYWSTTGASSVSVSGLNNYYNQSLSGSALTSAIYGNQTFTLTAYCQSGQTQVQTVTVSTSQPVQSTQVLTGAPTSITQTTARLNGNLVQSGGLSTQVYFQWGTSTAYGNVTPQQSMGTASNTFWNIITGLSPNTTYHYRAVAVNSSGTFYGDDQAFTTVQTTVVVPPTVITVTSGTGSGSNLIALDINNNQQINACVGNIVNYLVTYKNISGHTLNNAVLQVILPEDVQFQSSNPGIYNVADHTVTLAIGTLAKDQVGTMNITGVVLRSAINRNLIVAEATIAFTNPSTNNSQESAIAYGLGNTTNCNSLAGLALFGNGFWPTTLIGWLVLLLILLILIYLAILLRRNYYRSGPSYQAAGMKNSNTHTGGNAQHYEDMDVPVYNNH